MEELIKTDCEYHIFYNKNMNNVIKSKFSMEVFHIIKYVNNNLLSELNDMLEYNLTLGFFGFVLNDSLKKVLDI
jgi:hypothetical protein